MSNRGNQRNGILLGIEACFCTLFRTVMMTLKGVEMKDHVFSKMSKKNFIYLSKLPLNEFNIKNVIKTK